MNHRNKLVVIVTASILVAAFQVAWHVSLERDTPGAKRALRFYLNSDEEGNHYRKHDAAMFLDLIIPSMIVSCICGALGIAESARQMFAVLISVCLFFMSLQIIYAHFLTYKLWWLLDGSRVARESIFEVIYVSLLLIFSFGLGSAVRNRLSTWKVRR